MDNLLTGNIGPSGSADRIARTGVFLRHRGTTLAKKGYIVVLGQVRYTFSPEILASRESAVLHQPKNRYRHRPYVALISSW